MTNVHVLHTGRYKTLTNKVCTDIISLIKNSKHIPTYKRRKILYEAHETRPHFEEQKAITYGVYTAVQLDMIFSLNIKLNRDFGESNIIVDGYADEGVASRNGDIETLPSIEINIAFPGQDEERRYTEIMAWLKDVVRHEIEHLTQRGINAKTGKRRRLNLARRCEIMGDPKKYYKYYTLIDEIEPNLHGLNSMAKYKREPLASTIDSYLNFLTRNGTIQEHNKQQILHKWRKVGRRLNLPNF
jgi:hypothetical protein